MDRRRATTAWRRAPTTRDPQPSDAYGWITRQNAPELRVASPALTWRELRSTTIGP